jgi:hypothetical protein
VWGGRRFYNCRDRRRPKDRGLTPYGIRPQLGYHRSVAEEHAQPLEQQLEEIGSRLAWVRDYL